MMKRIILLVTNPALHRFLFSVFKGWSSGFLFENSAEIILIGIARLWGDFGNRCVTCGEKPAGGICAEWYYIVKRWLTGVLFKHCAVFGEAHFFNFWKLLYGNVFGVMKVYVLERFKRWFLQRASFYIPCGKDKYFLQDVCHNFIAFRIENHKFTKQIFKTFF